MLIIFLIPLQAFAWNTEDHKIVALISLQKIAQGAGLYKPQTIRPLTPFLMELRQYRPELKTDEDFSNFIRINPATPLNQLDVQERWGDTIEPIRVLGLYAPAPDDGRDNGIPTKGTDQFWFGAQDGMNSQAFRHIEKPPLNLLRFNDTFGFPPWSLGEATNRVELYYNLALLARHFGEEYWGWRFLGYAFHYVQDLYQPFHATQVSPEIAVEGVRAYWKWGRKEGKGFMGTTGHLMTNLHRFFEDETVFWTRQGKFSDDLQGTDFQFIPTSVKEYAVGIRDDSNHWSSKTLAVTKKLASPLLLTSYNYEENTELVEEFLQNDSPNFEENRQEYFSIVANRYQ
ncbi:MAG: hypothetical protein Q7S00_02450, partial [bacterium]|nr:hypothetical protein [bacterium]